MSNRVFPGVHLRRITHGNSRGTPNQQQVEGGFCALFSKIVSSFLCRPPCTSHTLLEPYIYNPPFHRLVLLALQGIPEYPPDPVLDISRQYKADTFPNKVDLGEFNYGYAGQYYH